MHRYITYYIFAIASFIVVVLFVTATTYAQLILAILLYPGLAYFALRIFSHRIKKSTPPSTTTASFEVPGDVADIDKRAFLKVVGATGMFFFLTTLLGKRLDAVLFGKSIVTDMGTKAPLPSQAKESGSLIANGFQIAEVDDNVITYYGFTNENGSWLIMREDTESSSFRYATGDGNFPGNWAKRESLDYDYYYNLF